MSNIYIFPGLGATPNDFAHLDIGSYTLVAYSDWKKSDTIHSFSEKLCKQIPEHAILLGFSLGGILAIECAKKVSAKKVILVSSIETKKDVPFSLKIISWILPLFGKKFITHGTNLLAKMNIISHEMAHLVYLRISAINWSFLIRSVRHICSRKNTSTHHVFHIHGSNDTIFPIKKLHCISNVVIANAGHFLLNQHGEEISYMIKNNI